MKLGFYKVGNSQGYGRHTFDNMYDKPEEIERMLQPLLNDDDEAAIINLDDCESVELFAEEHNDDVYNGYWCVVIREKKTTN